jgi:hypothetical protein
LKKEKNAMDLREIKFYSAGEDLNFTVFSDHLCRVKHVESIPVPIGGTLVDVYTIDPGPGSRWVVVQQKESGNSCLKFFVRKGDLFRENLPHRLSKGLREDILHCIPALTKNHQLLTQSGLHFRQAW